MTATPIVSSSFLESKMAEQPRVLQNILQKMADPFALGKQSGRITLPVVLSSLVQREMADSHGVSVVFVSKRNG